jgi:Ser/Thr protein kinase RdoA (MazF antagonist)
MTTVAHEAKQDLTILSRLAESSLAAWGIGDAVLALIKHRENAVFKVSTSSGQSFALRIHRGGYHTDAELRSELQWMAALQNDGVDVPQVIPTLTGDLFIVAAMPGTQEPLQLDLFAWIDGEQLGTAENGLGKDAANIARIYRVIGNVAARLHNHAASWPLPDGFVRHAWDAEGLVGEQPFWGRFWELAQLSPDQRALLQRARDIVRQELDAMAVDPQQAPFYGLIHADFVPENLMVADGKVRLLDFDDAGFGWHLFEIATALYFIRNDPHYATARDALVAGYREFRSLPDEVLAKLPVLMMARGFTYVGWVHTRSDTKAAHELAEYVVKLACDFATDFVSSCPEQR